MLESVQFSGRKGLHGMTEEETKDLLKEAEKVFAEEANLIQLECEFLPFDIQATRSLRICLAWLIIKEM
jgi:hypothetical protein